MTIGAYEGLSNLYYYRVCGIVKRVTQIFTTINLIFLYLFIFFISYRKWVVSVELMLFLFQSLNDAFKAS